MPYVRVTYPQIQCLDNNGNFAMGYEVTVYKAGTATALTSYSDRGCTTPNTNPVILDARGEASIFLKEAAKLLFSAPGASTAIWTIDYYGEFQANFTTGSATPVTSHNNYVVDTVPPVTALENNFMLLMTPDVDNADTITSAVFTGTGVEDLSVSGAYVGSTSGSIFSVEIDATVQLPPIAPVAHLSTTAGSVTTGNHFIKQSAVTAEGETTTGGASNQVVADNTHKIDVDGIPAIAGEITGYNVYMTKAGGSTYYLVNAAPITTISYAIDITDAVLETHDEEPTGNTTGAGTTDSFKWKKDGGAETTGVAITGAAQSLSEGVKVTFSSLTGHVKGDIWAITVETPTRVNLDSLGNLIVYKNKGADIVPIEGGDMQAGYGAQLFLNGALNAWLLSNPATPVISSPTISATRYRKNLTADYTMVLADQGKELSCIGTFTVTLMDCPDFAEKFLYIKNTGNGAITIDAGSYLIKGYGNSSGSSTFLLARNIELVQLATDGIDWHILSMVVSPSSGGGSTGGYDVYNIPGTFYWTCPVGVTSISISVQGGGGGGGCSSWGDGLYGYAGAPGTIDTDSALVVTPGDTYTVYVAHGGAGAPGSGGGADGAAGGTSTFKTAGAVLLMSGAGGAGGLKDAPTLADTVPVGNGGAGGLISGQLGYQGGRGNVTITY